MCKHLNFKINQKKLLDTRYDLSSNSIILQWMADNNYYKNTVAGMNNALNELWEDYKKPVAQRLPVEHLVYKIVIGKTFEYFLKIQHVKAQNNKVKDNIDNTDENITDENVKFKPNLKEKLVELNEALLNENVSLTDVFYEVIMHSIIVFQCTNDPTRHGKEKEWGFFKKLYKTALFDKLFQMMISLDDKSNLFRSIWEVLYIFLNENLKMKYTMNENDLEDVFNDTVIYCIEFVHKGRKIENDFKLLFPKIRTIIENNNLPKDDNESIKNKIAEYTNINETFGNKIDDLILILKAINCHLNDLNTAFADFIQKCDEFLEEHRNAFNYGFVSCNTEFYLKIQNNFNTIGLRFINKNNKTIKVDEWTNEEGDNLNDNIEMSEIINLTSKFLQKECNANIKLISIFYFLSELYNPFHIENKKDSASIYRSFILLFLNMTITEIWNRIKQSHSLFDSRLLISDIEYFENSLNLIVKDVFTHKTQETVRKQHGNKMIKDLFLHQLLNSTDIKLQEGQVRSWHNRMWDNTKKIKNIKQKISQLCM